MMIRAPAISRTRTADDEYPARKLKAMPGFREYTRFTVFVMIGCGK